VGSNSSSDLNSDDEERIVFNKDLDLTRDIRERERLSENKITSMQSPQLSLIDQCYCKRILQAGEKEDKVIVNRLDGK